MALQVDHKLVLDAFADAVVASDGADRIVYANAATERLLGWTAAELLGRPLTALMPARMRAAHAAGFRRYLETYEARLIGRPVRVPALRRDGGEVEVELTLTAYRQAGGEDLIVGSLRDLRDRVELERQLTITRYLHAATRAAARLTSQLDDQRALLATAVETLVQDFDAALARIWLFDPASGSLQLAASDGLSREVSGGPRAHIDVASYPFKVARVARTREPFVRSGLVGDPEFDQEWVTRERLEAAAIFPLVAGGELRGVVAAFFRHGLPAEVVEVFGTLATMIATVLNDVRLLAQARAAQRQAEESSRAKDEFLSVLSHEVRTPLTAILGWASLLASGALPRDKHARAIAVIDRSARAQAELIDDLLDFSRIISGKLRLDVEPVRFVEVVEAAVETVQPTADARGVRLELDLDPDVGAVQGDPGRLRQVLWNLLTNAVKFTPRGGRVGVAVRGDVAQVELVVTDTGQGIDEAFLPIIFSRFTQQDASITRAQGGLGLGLAIVKHLVELHGGTIEAGSEGPGRGATFTVRLPTASARTSSIRPPPPRPAARAPADDPPDGAAHGAADAPADGPPALAGLTVLLVEDEDDTREFIQATLEQQGAVVTSCASAAEALGALRAALPDLLVSDIGMPGEDGYSLVRRLRALPPAEGGRTPAIALTAYARTEDRTRALVAGFTAHVAKPVDPAELVIVCASVTGRLSPRGG